MSTVKAIMTKEVLTVGSDWPLERLSGFFFDNHISGAPVVDDNNQLVGVVSVTDLAHNKALNCDINMDVETHEYYMCGQIEHAFTYEESSPYEYAYDDVICVKDIMTPMIFEINVNASVKQAAEIMLQGRIHRVFITKNRKIVGIVSAMDLLKVIRDSSCAELTSLA